MNNKKYIILGLVTIVLLAVVGFLLFRLVKAPNIISNNNLNNININIDTCVDKRQQTKYGMFEIPLRGFFSILNFYTFCQIKDAPSSLTAKCDENFISRNYICTSDLPHLVMIYYLKQGNKDKFLNICEDHKKVNTWIQNQDCNNLWEINKNPNLELCDDPALSCGYLVTEADKNSCKHPVNLSSTPVETIADINCKDEILYRKAMNVSDCLNLDDDITRFLCLDLYTDKGICSSVSDFFDSSCKIVNTDKIKTFSDKYNVKNCCYDRDTMGDELTEEKLPYDVNFYFEQIDNVFYRK